MQKTNPNTATKCVVLDENKVKSNRKFDQLIKKRLCRLCRRTDDKECFIRACNCQGAFAFVHKTCIQNWIEATKENKCDICRKDFHVKLSHRSIFEWILVCVHASGEGKLYYYSSFVLLLFLSEQ